jgi:ribosomal protein L16 Arg81 hydroxylase
MSNSDWVGWAAENIVLGVPPKDIVDVMCASGIEKTKATQILNKVVHNPLFSSYKKLCADNRKLSSIMVNLRELQQQDTYFTSVPKINAISAEEFFNTYWLQNRPVVLKQLASNWPALDKWTMKYLADTFGDELIEIQDGRTSDSLYEMHSIKHKTKVKVKDFVARIASGPSNDFYMTANNHALQTTLFSLLTDIGQLPSYVRAPRVGDGGWHLWLGPQGTITPLHHDENALLHTQIQGCKRWKLISPLDTPNLYNHKAVFSSVDLYSIDFKHFPKMQGVPILDVVVEPGETLFLPLGWWHGVESLTPSISLSFTSFTYPNNWVFDNP